MTRIGLDGKTSVVSQHGGRPNGAAFGADGKIYIYNSGGFHFNRDEGLWIPARQAHDYSGWHIKRLDRDTGKIEVLYTNCVGYALKGPSDLVFEASGGFYFTDHGNRRPREVDLGGLYYAKPDGNHIRELVQPMIMPNGGGLSPGGMTVYVAETRTGHLLGFDVEGVGRVKRHPP